MNKGYKNKIHGFLKIGLFQKQAQESRNDMMVWYMTTFAIVFISVFALYSFGFVGNGISSGGLIESNSITAAAIVEEPLVEEVHLVLVVNETVDNSSLS